MTRYEDVEEAEDEIAQCLRVVRGSNVLKETAMCEGVLA